MYAVYDSTMDYKLRYLWKCYIEEFEENVSFNRYVKITTDEYMAHLKEGEIDSLEEWLDCLVDMYENGFC